MRYVAVVVILGAALAAALVPGPEPTEPGPPPAAELPPVSICPIVQSAERSTSVSVLS